MSNKQKQQIILLIAFVLIIGTISFIESGKVERSGDAGNQDIIIIPDIITEDIGSGNEKVSGTSDRGVNAQGTNQNKENATAATPNVVSYQERIALKQSMFDVAKEISTPDAFINVDNITVQELIGKKVILVDFWTYSCINCQRTLPFLNNWYQKYADDGLVILGIHTPEFEFEKDYDNVSRAVEKWAVEYPVILDNDFSTWRSYKNRYWPRKYLIDVDGFIVYDHIGEGAYDETEAKIVELLNEKNEILGMGEVVMDTSAPSNIDQVDFLKVRTPETYLGAERIEFLANLENCSHYVPCEYMSSGDVTLNTFEFDGLWNIQPEYAVLESDGGSIRIRFNASKVNLVAESPGGVEADIYLDGELVTDTSAGYSAKDGMVMFKESDLYNLVDLQGTYGEHLLEIQFRESGVQAFAFTFG